MVMEQRASVISIVKTPLGFLTLIVLVIEVALGTIIVGLENAQRGALAWGMLAVLVLAIGAVVVLEMRKQRLGPSDTAGDNAQIKVVESIESRVEFYRLLHRLIALANKIVWDTTWGVSGSERNTAEHNAYLAYRNAIAVELKNKSNLEYREIYAGRSNLTLDTMNKALTDRLEFARNWKVRFVSGLDEIPMVDVLVFDDSEVVFSQTYGESKWRYVHVRDRTLATLMAEHLKEVWRLGFEAHIKDSRIWYKGSDGRDIEVRNLS